MPRLVAGAAGDTAVVANARRVPAEEVDPAFSAGYAATGASAAATAVAGGVEITGAGVRWHNHEIGA